MQNVVEVACSSPPVTMNATKPAAQAVQAADQDSFDLVLQKTAERIANDKQSDSANKCNDSRTMDNKHGSESVASKKVSDTKNESEANKTGRNDKSVRTDEPDKSEKPHKADKHARVEKSVAEDQQNTATQLDPSMTTNSADKLVAWVDSEKPEDTVNPEISEKNTGEIADVDPSAMVFGYVAPAITVAENTTKAAETVSEIAGETIQPVNLVQVDSTTAVQENNKVLNPKVAADQATLASTSDSTDPSQDPKVEGETTISFTETLEKGAKIGEKTTTDLKPAAGDPNEKLEDGGKVSVSTNTNSQGEQVISISRKYQEVSTTNEAAVPVREKPTEVGASSQAAPPDIPEGTTSAAASAAVQTATQISEPARLAEAPKNEVITQVANQIDQMVKTNRSSVRMQLYPEELGHIDLRIVTTKDGISVTMLTEKASTQQVLKSDMDVLKQNIEQAGIQLTNLNINQGQNSNRQQAFDHQQNFSNNSYPGSGSNNSNSSSHEPKKHLTSSLVDYKV